MLLHRLKIIILSIYLYNEHQGFTQLESLLSAFKVKYPSETEMIEAISKHATDEKKHYLMFAGYFSRTGYSPISVGSTFGYVDQLISNLFGKSITKLDQTQIIENQNLFLKLLRAIMITEERGLKQVQWLLKRKFILNDPLLKSIFSVIVQDEPSHFMPYRNWLEKNHAGLVSWRERLADFRVHYSLIMFKIPLLYLKFW